MWYWMSSYEASSGSVSRSCRTLSSRPTDTRCGRLNGHHLARTWTAEHARRTIPLGRHHEQSLSIRAPKRARETAAIKLNCLQHLTALANAYATLVRDVPVPDGILGVEADPVGDAVAEVGPHPAFRQVAVRCDMEGREPFAIRLGNDQRRVVGRHDHTVREGDAIGHLSNRTIMGDQSDESGGELFTGHQIKTGAVDIDVAPTVHHHLVPATIGNAAQIGMRHQRAVGFPAQEKPIA